MSQENLKNGNVALWIKKDESLCTMARDHARNCSGTNRKAAQNMLDELRELGITKTPDGVLYSVSSICAAMSGM